MTDQDEWAFPRELQPRAEEYAFDLSAALDAVVALRADVPEDAFTAAILGTERTGNGVVIRDDGLILTIGYLITEAQTIWLTANDGTVVQGYPLAYDFTSGFGLVQPLGRLGGAGRDRRRGDRHRPRRPGPRAQGTDQRQARIRRLLGVHARRSAVHRACPSRME